MNDREKLEEYEKLVRRIVVHANNFADVLRFIKQFTSENPELTDGKPWFL